jgi:hypothetical protein
LVVILSGIWRIAPNEVEGPAFTKPGPRAGLFFFDEKLSGSNHKGSDNRLSWSGTMEIR